MTRSKRVLIIDDDYLVLKSFKKLLNAKGYEAQTAVSHQQAMELLEWNDFQIILSDIRMPKKNGVEIVGEIQKKLADSEKGPLPVVFMTGYADDADELEAENYGTVLYKPIDEKVLLNALKECL